MQSYTDLEAMIAAVETLKVDCLFDSEDAVSSLPPQSEQHFLTAMALLSQASAALTLAHYNRMRGD